MSDEALQVATEVKNESSKNGADTWSSPRVLIAFGALIVSLLGNVVQVAKAHLDEKKWEFEQQKKEAEIRGMRNEEALFASLLSDDRLELGMVRAKISFLEETIGKVRVSRGDFQTLNVPKDNLDAQERAARGIQLASEVQKEMEHDLDQLISRRKELEDRVERMAKAPLLDPQPAAIIDAIHHPATSPREGK